MKDSQPRICKQCCHAYHPECDLCPQCHMPFYVPDFSNPDVHKSLPPVSSGTPMPAVKQPRQKPLNPLAQCVQDMCCGTTCDKQPIVQRIDELESQCKGLQADLDGVDDLNATFDERVEKKCKLTFCTVIEQYSDRLYDDSQVEKRWLQFKAEQGL